MRTYDRRLARDIVLLLNREPFYGHLLTSFRKVAPSWNPSVTTAAAVSMTGQVVTLLITEEYFNQPVETRIFILKHEVYHVVARHLIRMASKLETENIKANLACDLATNQYIGPPFPRGVVLPRQYKLPLNKTVEWYFSRLPQIDQYVCLDSHIPWDGTELPNVVKEAVIRRLVEQAEKAAGSLPGEFEGLLAVPSVNPLPLRQYIERFMSSGQSRLDFTKKRKSKRYKTVPGIRIRPRGKGVLVVDTSASISDKQLAYFLGVVNNRAQENELILLEVDTRVANVTDPYTPLSIVEVHGRGGTKFVPAFEKVQEEYHDQVDYLMYLTDGINYDSDDLQAFPRPPYPVLWILANADRNFPFGESIVLDI